MQLARQSELHLPDVMKNGYSLSIKKTAFKTLKVRVGACFVPVGMLKCKTSVETDKLVTLVMRAANAKKLKH